MSSLPHPFDPHAQAARGDSAGRAQPGPAVFQRGQKEERRFRARTRSWPAQVQLRPDKLVWPSPPNIARIHWVDYFAGAKIDYTPVAASKPKASWMDRLAGAQPDSEKVNQ